MDHRIRSHHDVDRHELSATFAWPMTTPSEAVEIYCVKCKAKTASKDIEAVTMKNGHAATRSICVDCGTKKFRIGVLP